MEKTQKDLTSKIRDESEVGAMKIREVTAQLKKENEEMALVNGTKKKNVHKAADLDDSDEKDDDSITSTLPLKKSTSKKAPAAKKATSRTSKAATTGTRGRKKKEESEGKG